MPSTVIRSYHYDRRRRELDVVFQSRRRYTYQGVPQETYDAMKAAFSKGEFFNRHIRDHFPFERTGEEHS
ncbi:KTSC domain-containing protein [Reyranella sp.]|uniref:KTSC domain-containing protein n=1 Tax=Reyranella sp. TaxID=1929291 RepID=UPI003D1231A0